MKVGISTATFFSKVLTEDSFSVIQRCGGDTCEVFLTTFYEYKDSFGRLLKEQNMQSTGQGQSDFPYRFYVSDLAEKFKGFANSILPFDVEKTQKIDIEKY